jgi:pimeloyl-ACP methyl ester carboxylesterase
MTCKNTPGVNVLKLFILCSCITLCSFGGCKNNLLYVSPGNFYIPGELEVQVISLDAGQEFSNPVQMDIYTPKDSFRYPVIIFQHGFTASIKDYATILHQLASHGFVVVAPQMYPPGGDSVSWPTYEEEAALGVQIISWLQENLNNIVPVKADTSLLGLAGHSRGGQAAYRMASLVPEKAAALAGVDPVDGTVAYVNGPLNFTFPTYILGTGLGAEPVPGTPFPCAPTTRGYQHFYDANPSPSWLAVTTENGHTDMIDEDVLCPNSVCNISCPGGPNRDGMRSFTAGTLAAFFSGALQGQKEAMEKK